MTNELRGDRLLALRHLLGITQTEMANDLDVSGGFLSQVVQGRRNFPESLAYAASERYRVPYSFFLVSTEPEDVGPVTFRKTSTARARDENRIVQLYTEAAHLYREASYSSGYHQADLPDPTDFHHDPELLASAVRQRVGLGPGDPVRNVIRLCERLGVGVVHVLDPKSAGESHHAGASRPRSWARPLIALASELPPAVKRLTLAHELIHIIADRDLDRALTKVRDAREKRAFRFAGALMLPADVARERISETLTLHGYLRVKADYGISVRALIHRAEDLGLITGARARSLYIQWSSQGWRTDEPVPVADERPLLLGQALEHSRASNYAAKASNELGVPAELITVWVGAPDRSGHEVAAVLPLDSARRR